MIDDLNQIKHLRRKFGLSQKELALASYVSQSLIAKVERGDLEPSYSKAKAIFLALESVSKNEEKKAKDLMQKKILFCDPEDSVINVIKTMKKKGISQLPVRKDNVVLGIVSERAILEGISKFGGIIGKVASDIMDECPPIVTLKTSQNTVLELLKEYSIVLVSDKGSVKGIISKSDLLSLV